MIDYKKDIEIDKLSILEPQKHEYKWEMKVLYEDIYLSFQTPSLKLHKHGGLLEFDSSKKHSFFKFIDNLESCVIDYLYQNSEKMFKGKVFSKEKLKQSLLTSWNISDDGMVYLDINNMMANTKFVSAFGDPVDYDQLSQNVICIIVLEAVNFSKNQFELKYSVSHMKSKRVDNIKESFFEKKSTLVEDDKMDFFTE